MLTINDKPLLALLARKILEKLQDTATGVVMHESIEEYNALPEAGKKDGKLHLIKG